MKLALKWIVGIGCVLLGLAALATSIVGGFLFLLAAVFLIPPLFDKINSGGKINRLVKIIIPLLGIFVGFIVIGTAVSEEVDVAAKEIKEKKKEQYARLTKEQKDSVANIERLTDSLKIVERQKRDAIKRQKEIDYRKKNTMSARDLYAYYEANEVSADQNFKNKIFYVSGVVEEIKKDFLDNIYITLKTGQMFSFVNCYLDDERTAAELKKGQKVTFKGKCKGMVITVVTMEDCEIVENLK